MLSGGVRAERSGMERVGEVNGDVQERKGADRHGIVDCVVHMNVNTFISHFFYSSSVVMKEMYILNGKNDKGL